MFSERHLRLRHVAGLLISCALTALLRAATPEPRLTGLDVLDEALVTAKVSWPIEDYVDYPQFDEVVISPRGSHLAMTWQHVSAQLSIVELPSLRPRNSGHLQMYAGVTNLRWVDESRLALQSDWPSQGFRHVREPLGTLLVTDLDRRILREVNPFAQPTTSFSLADTIRSASGQDFDTGFSDGKIADSDGAKARDALGELRLVEQIARQTGEGKGPLSFGPVRLINARPIKPDQLLFQTLWTGEADKGGYGVFELDLVQCKQVRVASLPLRGGEVITGTDHQPAVVAGVNEAGERVVYFLPGEARARGVGWELRARTRSGERGLLPLAWTGQDEKYFALDGRDLPTRAVVVWNASDNSHEVLYQHPDADIDAASLDPAGKPWMFSGLSQYPVYWYPDPDHPLAQLHRDLVQRLPRERVDILNATDDLATAVVRVSAGARPTVFMVLDVKSGKSLAGMLAYPKLRGRRISPVEAIEFNSRDGLPIRGYLTTPLDQDGELRRGVPLLVIAHDGPSGELPDYRYIADPRYDFERQLFASRGYAVLQVNARGTPGRGTAFQRAGDGEWGRKVQDDFADAVRWAIKHGIAAEGRVCFYGTGYGAYSALMAAAREPELFKCVIGVAGVYDLPRLVQAREEVRSLTASVPIPEVAQCQAMAKEIAKEIVRPRRDSRRQLNNAIEALHGKKGAPRVIPSLLQRAFGNDLEQLRLRSPVTHASTIQAQVLLVRHFGETPTNQDQLAAMQKALQVARNPAETATFGDGFNYRFVAWNPKVRADAYKKMLGFLEGQIGN